MKNKKNKMLTLEEASSTLQVTKEEIKSWVETKTLIPAYAKKNKAGNYWYIFEEKDILFLLGNKKKQLITKNKETMTINEVADFLGKSSTTIRVWIKKGKIDPVLNLKNKYCFEKEYIHDFKPKLNKKNKLKREVSQINAVKKFRLNEEEKNIISFWNKFATSLKDTRHMRTVQSQIPKIKLNITRICRITNIEYILEQLDLYIAVCKNQGNIINKKDYSYTALHRFLGRVYDNLTNQKVNWWITSAIENSPVEDIHPKLTQFVGDMFAIRFLGKKTFSMDNPSKDYKDFFKIGERVSYIIKYYKNSDIYSSSRPLSFIVDLVFDCIVNQYSDRTIYPASISRDKFWEIEFTQYLRREFFVTLNWDKWDAFTRRKNKHGK